MLVPVFCLHQALFLLDPAFPFSPAQLCQVLSVLLSLKNPAEKENNVLLISMTVVIDKESALLNTGFPVPQRQNPANFHQQDRWVLCRQTSHC